jgi:hypothetical protein
MIIDDTPTQLREATHIQEFLLIGIFNSKRSVGRWKMEFVQARRKVRRIMVC